MPASTAFVASQASASKGRARYTCDSVEDDALSLRLASQSCTGGLACELVDTLTSTGTSSCLDAFQCAGAFPVGADLTAMFAQAALLSDRSMGCGVCGCDGDVRAFCNGATGLREVGPAE